MADWLGCGPAELWPVPSELGEVPSRAWLSATRALGGAKRALDLFWLIWGGCPDELDRP